MKDRHCQPFERLYENDHPISSYDQIRHEPSLEDWVISSLACGVISLSSNELTRENSVSFLITGN